MLKHFGWCKRNPVSIDWLRSSHIFSCKWIIVSTILVLSWSVTVDCWLQTQTIYRYVWWIFVTFQPLPWSFPFVKLQKQLKNSKETASGKHISTKNGNFYSCCWISIGYLSPFSGPEENLFSNRSFDVPVWWDDDLVSPGVFLVLPFEVRCKRYKSQGLIPMRDPQTILGGGNSNIFGIFTPILGVSWSNLTVAYFSFNHQLESIEMLCFFVRKKGSMFFGGLLIPLRISP